MQSERLQLKLFRLDTFYQDNRRKAISYPVFLEHTVWSRKKVPLLATVHGHGHQSAALRWYLNGLSILFDGSVYIPCLDNKKWLDSNRHHKHYEHRERHCPSEEELPKCLVPMPPAYKAHIKWADSRDQVSTITSFLDYICAKMRINLFWWIRVQTWNSDFLQILYKSSKNNHA